MTIPLNSANFPNVTNPKRGLMPLTKKGKKILKSMKKQYGTKKGKEVFYASQNKGKIKGTHKSHYDRRMG